MPNPEQIRKQELWSLYKSARKMQRDGVELQRISAALREHTKEWGKPINGVQSLLNELGIEHALGDDGGLERARGFAANIAQGAYLGGHDELVGLVEGAVRGVVPGGMGFREGYEHGRDRQRDIADKYRAEHPRLGLAGEIGGAAAPALLTGGAAAGAAGQGSLVSRAVQGGLTMGLMGGAEGAAYGALSSPGEGLADRATGGAVGGGLGALGGGIFGVAGPIAGALSRQATRGAAAMGVPGAAAVRDRQVRRLAERELRDRLGQSGSTVEEIASRLEEMPAMSVIADADPSLQRGARAARNAAPELDRIGGPVERITARHNERGVRATEALRGGTGLRRVENPDAVLEKGIEAWRKQHEIPFLQDLGEQTVGSPTIRRVLKENEYLTEALHYVGANVDEIKQTQKLKVEDGWSALQDMGKRLKGDLTVKERRLISEARDALAEEMERLVPGFADMRAQYRMIQERFGAYNAGRKARMLNPRDAKATIDGMGAHEAQAYREGLMDAWEEAFARSPSEVEKFAGAKGRELGDRIRNLFPDGPQGDVAFLDFLNKMDVEGRWAQTYAAIKGNSTTAMQQQDELGAVVTRMPSLVNEVLSIFVSDPNLRNAVGKELGEILLSEGPDAMIEAAIRAERAHAARVGREGAVLLGTGQASRAASQGVFADQISPEEKYKAGLFVPYTSPQYQR